MKLAKINNLPLNPNDKVVRFNHSGNEDIIQDRTDIAVFRNNNTFYWYKQHCQNYFYISTSSSIFIIISLPYT